MASKIKRYLAALLMLVLVLGMLPCVNASAATTQTGILLFDYSDNGDYTSRLNSQIAVTYKPNGTGSSKTAYIKNLGWHFARYGNVPYADDLQGIPCPENPEIDVTSVYRTGAELYNPQNRAFE